MFQHVSTCFNHPKVVQDFARIHSYPQFISQNSGLVASLRDSVALTCSEQHLKKTVNEQSMNKPGKSIKDNEQHLKKWKCNEHLRRKDNEHVEVKTNKHIQQISTKQCKRVTKLDKTWKTIENQKTQWKQ